MLEHDTQRASCAAALKGEQAEPVPGPVLHAFTRDTDCLRAHALGGSVVDPGAPSTTETCMGPEYSGPRGTQDQLQAGPIASNENMATLTSSSDDEAESACDRRSILLQAKIRGFHLPMPRPHTDALDLQREETQTADRERLLEEVLKVTKDSDVVAKFRDKQITPVCGFESSHPMCCWVALQRFKNERRRNREADTDTQACLKALGGDLRNEVMLEYRTRD